MTGLNSNKKENDILGFDIKIDAQMAKFVLTFAVSMAILYMASMSFENLIPLFNQRSIASVLFSVLKFLGISTSLAGNTIGFPGFSLVIISQCTGIFELISLFSCMLAYPTTLKNKIIGMTSASLFVYSLNMVRLIFLSLLGVYFYALFDTVHTYIFQITFVSLVIIIWIVWIDFVKKYGK